MTDLQKAEIIALRLQGLTYTEIAKKLKTTRNTVSGILYRAGETRDRSQSQRRTLDSAFKNLVASAQGSTYVVGKEWGVSPSSVSEWRRGLGVPRIASFD